MRFFSFGRLLEIPSRVLIVSVTPDNDNLARFEFWNLLISILLGRSLMSFKCSNSDMQFRDSSISDPLSLFKLIFKLLKYGRFCAILTKTCKI